MPARRHLLQVLALFCFGSSIAFAQLTYPTTFISHPDGSPGGLAIADFDRDGKPDVGVVHGSIVSIYFNQGAGNFSDPVDTFLDPSFVFVQALAADVNNDGKTDMVILLSQPTQVLVLLGNGDGTFQAPLALPLVNSPFAMGLGDFNGDGKIDLAVRECPLATTNCDIAVYRGKGNGTFALDTVLPAPGSASSTRSLVVTDLNRDGTLDIATAALSGPSATPTANFTVFFGRGDGSFRAPVVTPVAFTGPEGSVASVPSIVAGDFNGESTPDLAVEAGSECGSACGQGTMNIFIDNGAGGFKLKQSFPSSPNEGPNNWLAADLNNDLRTDLARFSGSVRSGSFQAWAGSGTGTFSTITSSFSTANPSYVETRDMDLSGRHDLIMGISDFDTTGLLVALNQNGTPNCPPPPSNVLQAKLCTPTATTSSTTFTVKASGNSPVGIKRLEIWVDGTKRAQALDDQLLTTLTLTKGTHQVTVVAVDQYIGIAKTSRTVKVQ